MAVAVVIMSLFVRVEVEPYPVKEISPIIIAVQSGAATENVAGILDVQPNAVNDYDMSGMTPLHYAVIHGDLQLVQLLLERGANVHSQIKPGWAHAGFTPLHFSSLYRHSTIAALLLKHGADPNLPAEDGQTAIQLARERKADTVLRAIERASE